MVHRLAWIEPSRTPSGYRSYEEADAERLVFIKTAQRLGLPIGGGTDANRVMIFNPFVSLRWMLDGKTVDVTGKPINLNC